jgi:arabinan endo-1,5-alpha-L-arabinosidase
VKIWATGFILVVLLAGCRPVQQPSARDAALPLEQATQASDTTPIAAPAEPAGALAAQAPAMIEPQGFIDRIHDPVMAKEGDTYYVFSSGARIVVICSQDMVTWEWCYRVFDQPPSWVRQAVPGVGDLWAPDISYHNGKWQVYYSGSTMGSRDSVIGLATNTTLDLQSPDYAWVDEGEVLRTRSSSDYNAIDPNFVLDAQGQPWLVFGSYWSGIKLIALDKETRKPPAGAEVLAIAGRRDGPGDTEAIEGAFIISHGDYYYLFASFDRCCQGAQSDYNVRVGRSQEIIGPYVDRDGVPMLQGGGTQITGAYDRWRGPGHNGIFSENGVDWLVYHAYDANRGGISQLRIEPITWDEDGWPSVGSYASPE